MKACVLHAVGDLRCEETSTPAPAAGEVLVRVGACGVCGSDIPRIFTKGAYRFPMIPGHEFAGEVVALGAGVDPALLARRAAVFPLLPCRQCALCAVGAYAQCDRYGYLGSRSDGAFAEFVCVPVWNLLPIAETLSYEEAAMAEPAAVALHALRRAGLDAADTVAIFGAGPIGLLLAQWARNGGAARVLLLDIDGAKLNFAVRQGFHDVFNPARGDADAWVRGGTGGGADIVVEASGSAHAFEQGMKAARTFGRVVLLGNPAGEMKLSQDGYWAILRKELQVLGTWNSVYASLPKDEWRLALDAIAAGRLQVKPLITHRIALDALPATLGMMRDRSAFFAKVMYVAAAQR